MAVLSLKTIVSKLTEDIIVQTNVLSSMGGQIALVPLGKIDNYEHFIDSLSRELSIKLGNILIIKVDHMKNSGSDIQNKENIESLVDLNKRINVIHTTQIINTAHDYNSMLLNHSTLTNFFNKFSVVLFQYEENIFEKNPKIFKIQKNIVTLVNRKETTIEKISNVRRIKDRFEFRFLASIIF